MRLITNATIEHLMPYYRHLRLDAVREGQLYTIIVAPHDLLRGIANELQEKGWECSIRT